jgi:hypothetical protein
VPKLPGPRAIEKLRDVSEGESSRKVTKMAVRVCVSPD